MANEIVGIEVEVSDNGSAEETVGQIRTQLQQAREAAAGIAEQFGRNSTQFKAAVSEIESIKKSFLDAGGAADNIGGGIEDAVAPVKTLKQLLKEAREELIKAQAEFGDYSDEALNAARNVAAIRDQIQEANETADLFDPGKSFQAVVGVASSVAAGFSAAQGAMALLGVESESVEKALLKVQAAMSLAQGLSTIKDSIKDFERLGAIIKSTSLYQSAYNYIMSGTFKVQEQATAATVAGTVAIEEQGAATVATTVATTGATTAMIVLRSVMLTLGIGALVALIGFVVSKIIDWTSSTDTQEKAQKRLNDAIESSNDLLQTNLKRIEYSRQEAELRAKIAGKSAQDIQEINQRFRNDELNQLKDDNNRKYKLYQESVNNTLLSEDAKKKILDEATKARVAYNNKLRENEIGVLKDVATNAEKARDDAKKAADKAEQDRKKADEKAKQERDKAQREREASLKAALQAEQQTEDELFALHHNAQELELRNLSIKFGDRIAAYKKAGLDTTALVQAWEEEEAGIIDKYTKEAIKTRAERRQKDSDEEKESLSAHLDEIVSYTESADKRQLESSKTTEQQKAEIQQQVNASRLEELAAFHEQILTDTALTEDARVELLKKYDQQRTELEDEQAKVRETIAQREKDNKVAAAGATVTALNNFATLAGEATLAGKVLAIAATTIATYQSAQSSYNALSGIPIVGPVLGAVAAAGAVAAGIINIKKIVSVQIPGKGSGGSAGNLSAAPLTPTTPLTQTITQLNQDSINQLGNSTVKAVVTESDVTGSQERINRIHNGARLP